MSQFQSTNLTLKCVYPIKSGTPRPINGAMSTPEFVSHIECQRPKISKKGYKTVNVVNKKQSGMKSSMMIATPELYTNFGVQLNNADGEDGGGANGPKYSMSVSLVLPDSAYATEETLNFTENMNAFHKEVMRQCLEIQCSDCKDDDKWFSQTEFVNVANALENIKDTESTIAELEAEPPTEAIMRKLEVANAKLKKATTACDDALNCLFWPTVKYGKKDLTKKFPTISLKFEYEKDKDTAKCEFYNTETKKLIPEFNNSLIGVVNNKLTEKKKVITVFELAGVWITSGKASISFKARQILVRVPKESVSGHCLLFGDSDTAVADDDSEDNYNQEFTHPNTVCSATIVDDDDYNDAEPSPSIGIDPVVTTEQEHEQEPATEQEPAVPAPTKAKRRVVQK